MLRFGCDFNKHLLNRTEIDSEERSKACDTTSGPAYHEVEVVNLRLTMLLALR